MKTTGMVRRIDELGRIVIPKEIRKQLMMREGESIAFALEDEKIILTKFSMLNKIGFAVELLLDRLYEKYHNTFLLCDKKNVIACSSNGLAKYQRKAITKDCSLMIQKEVPTIEAMMEFMDETQKVTILPLNGGQENIGALFMLTDETPYYMIDETLLQFVKEVIEQEIEACG